ncbi:MAG: SusC/RagA family TonB-linked outer membrane protein [Paludibacter sp.]|jgi:TonB-linked SusC/RagA family outer membrane protein
MYKNRLKSNYQHFKVLVIALMVCSFNSATILAQEVASEPVLIKNTVQDLYGNPIPGVEVGIKNLDKQSITLADGSFELPFEQGDILTFTHKNYQYSESVISKKDKEKGLVKRLQGRYNKENKPITGPYGETYDQDSYLGSAATVYTEQLSSSGIHSTIIPGLTGRVPGLNIIQQRGARTHHTAANYNTSLMGFVPIFGTGALSDNSEFAVSSRGISPIVIVDGIQREFYSIDPDAIESVSLQKDALSSMFLGMESSRGALIITTKKPSSGAISVSLTGKYGINSPIKMPRPLDSYQYAYLLNEALDNDGKKSYYSYDDFAKFREQSSPYTHPNVNWFNEIFKSHASSQYYNLNVSGGGKVAQYYISLGYMGEEGLFNTSAANSYNTNLNYERYLITSKVNVNVTDDFTANILLIGRVEDGNQPGGNGSGYSELLSSVYTTPNAAYPVKNPDGSWGGNISYTNNLLSQTWNSGYLKDNARDVLGTVNLKYDLGKLVKGLSVHAVTSITTQTRSLIRRTKRSQVFQFKYDEDGNPVYTMFGTPSPQINSFSAISNYQDMFGRLSINYSNRFNKHGITAAVSGETRTRLVDFDLPEIPSNIIGNLSYDYNKKYFLQASVSESYYNRYRPGKRWGTFYAVGGGWDISKEVFMESANDVIDQLKLRVVYGLTGNGISNSGYYIWRQTYSSYGAAWYSLGTSESPGYFTKENFPLANPDITWEKARKFNAGFDAAFLNNQIQFSADYYYDYYFDLLQNRGKSIALIGASYPTENIGELARTGLELSMTYQNNIGKFNYYLTGNWNVSQSEILFMDEQAQPHDYLYRTGKPVGAFFGLTANGFLTAEDIANGYPVMQGFSNIQPGDVKYIDKNNDGVINEFDASVIGGDKPLSFFGAELGFEYKGFEFSTLLQGVYNRDIYISNRNFTQGFMQQNQHYGQIYEHLLNRWTPENSEHATYPRLSVGGNNYNDGNNWGTSLWLKSGNFLRLKNLNIAYTIPETIARQYIGNLRIKLFANAQNFLTVSAYKLIDPEVLFTNYPLQKSINFGVNVKF